MKNETKEYRNAQVQKHFSARRLELLQARQAAGLELSTGLRPDEVLLEAELSFNINRVWFDREAGRVVDVSPLRAKVAAAAENASPAFRPRIERLKLLLAKRLA